MYCIRNGQNFCWMITECACGTHPGNFVTCPVIDPLTTEVELTSTDTYRIYTGLRMHENWTNHTIIGQTAYQRTSNVRQPNVFIRCRPFKVLNTSKTCQQIGLDKTDITWHGTHLSHEELKRNIWMDTNGQTNLLFITHLLALSAKVWQSP